VHGLPTEGAELGAHDEAAIRGHTLEVDMVVGMAAKRMPFGDPFAPVAGPVVIECKVAGGGLFIGKKKF
jgi:hypothetical protein